MKFDLLVNYPFNLWDIISNNNQYEVNSSYRSFPACPHTNTDCDDCFYQAGQIPQSHSVFSFNKQALFLAPTHAQCSPLFIYEVDHLMCNRIYECNNMHLFAPVFYLQFIFMALTCVWKP